MSAVTQSKSGLVGYITLDNPKTLNALTHEMIHTLRACLQDLENDNDVQVIVLRSSNSRAFCAGGDMKATRRQAMENDWAGLHTFFDEEYTLNLAIANCSKPYVSLIDGIAMGGGLGLSVHGSHCVVSETAKMAMPETAIGFFPDVGGTYFLAKLKHNAGWWLGLTGLPIKGIQTQLVGLATHCVPVEKWDELMQSIEAGGASVLDSTLVSLASTATDAEFEKLLHDRSGWFPNQSFEAMMAQLQSESSAGNKDAARLLSLLKALSPMALRVTWRLLHEAENKDLAACLQAELAAGDIVVKHPDFIEGIRAVLVDKDHKPVWV